MGGVFCLYLLGLVGYVLFKSSISFSIICLVVLSIIESKILKSSSVIVEFSIFLQFCQFFLCVFWCSVVSCIYIYNYYIFLLDWPYHYYKMPSLSLLTYFVLKFILSNISIAISAFLWLLQSSFLNSQKLWWAMKLKKKLPPFFLFFCSYFKRTISPINKLSLSTMVHNTKTCAMWKLSCLGRILFMGLVN